MKSRVFVGERASNTFLTSHLPRARAKESCRYKLIPLTQHLVEEANRILRSLSLSLSLFPFPCPLHLLPLLKLMAKSVHISG